MIIVNKEIIKYKKRDNYEEAIKVFKFDGVAFPAFVKLKLFQ